MSWPSSRTRTCCTASTSPSIWCARCPSRLTSPAYRTCITSFFRMSTRSSSSRTTRRQDSGSLSSPLWARSSASASSRSESECPIPLGRNCRPEQRDLFVPCHPERSDRRERSRGTRSRWSSRPEPPLRRRSGGTCIFLPTQLYPRPPHNPRPISPFLVEAPRFSVVTKRPPISRALLPLRPNLHPCHPRKSAADFAPTHKISRRTLVFLDTRLFSQLNTPAIGCHLLRSHHEQRGSDRQNLSLYRH